MPKPKEIYRDSKDWLQPINIDICYLGVLKYKIDYVKNEN